MPRGHLGLSSHPITEGAPAAAAGARDPSGRVRPRVTLDRIEWGLLIALVVVALGPIVALLSTGGSVSGADGFFPTDQFQYFAWIREAAHHVLIGNPWDLAPGDRVFVHPTVLISAALHVVLGISIPLSSLVWKPVAILVAFSGSLLYVRRLLSGRGERHAALALALFGVSPAVVAVDLAGGGGKRMEYTFDFISNEMWTGMYLWGYFPATIAVFSVPLVLLALERWRATGRSSTLLLAAAGALMITWLQPWQGAELAAIVWGAELLRWWRRHDRVTPNLRMLVLVSTAIALPAMYYLILSHADPSWELAGKANRAGSMDLWTWPWWAIALVMGPIALPALLAYRCGPAVEWQDLALRLWPMAVLVVYLQPFGTFPFHSVQGLQLPLAILAVIGVRSVWPQISALVVLVLLAVMIVPGTVHKAHNFQRGVEEGNDPYSIDPGELALLSALEHDPRAGGVLAPTYAGLLVPSHSGRETYIGPPSWSPHWLERAIAVNALFENRLRDAAARRFVLSTHARWLFADCRPLARAELERYIAPLLARKPQRFGCATLYELKLRPGMESAAGMPDGD